MNQESPKQQNTYLLTACGHDDRPFLASKLPPRPPVVMQTAEAMVGGEPWPPSPSLRCNASGPSLVPWAATATVHTAFPNQVYSSNPHRLETVSRNVDDRTLSNNERTSPTLSDRTQEV